jgi:hypothetical protein
MHQHIEERIHPYIHSQIEKINIAINHSYHMKRKEKGGEQPPPSKERH